VIADEGEGVDGKLDFLTHFADLPERWTQPPSRAVSSPGAQSLSGTVEGVVAVDGKTLRRSFDRTGSKGAAHGLGASARWWP